MRAGSLEEAGRRETAFGYRLSAIGFRRQATAPGTICDKDSLLVSLFVSRAALKIAGKFIDFNGMPRKLLKSLRIPWSAGQFAEFGQNLTIFILNFLDSLLNSLFRNSDRPDQPAFAVQSVPSLPELKGY